MARVGRPVKKSGPAAARERNRARKAWRDLPLSERKKRVQERDKEAQKKGDAKRLASQRKERNAYHREQAKAVRGVPAGGKCSSCGSTKNVERHHKGGKVVKLCATCHAKARRAK